MTMKAPFNSILGIAGVALLVLAAGGCDRARPDTGSIEVITDPEGAHVYINGESKGVSPVKIRNLPAGSHLIQASRSGYRDIYSTVHLFEGQSVLHEIKMEPLRGLLLVETDPPGAEVILADSYRGETPLLVSNLPLGTYRMRLQADGHFPRELTVHLDRRTPKHVSTELPVDAATLVVRSTPEGGTVRIDGSSYEETPTRIERVRTGEVLVEISLDGYLPYQREMRLRSGEEYRLDATLIPLPGGLTVSTVPPEARVYLDGEYKGESPLSLTDLSVGTYTIRVERAGYAEQTRSVELESGDRSIAEFRLERDSGTIVLVTEPAEVTVYLSGENRGRTEAGRSDLLSEPFTIDYVVAGSHRLQLMREGYRHEARTVDVEANQTVSLHERMERLFIPDTVVRTGDRRGDVFRGVLIRTHPSGDIDLETRPGIIVTLSAEEIQSVEPLRIDD